MRKAAWLAASVGWCLVGPWCASLAAADAGVYGAPAQDSWTQKVGKFFSPPADKDAELPAAEKPKKAGPDLAVAMAQLAERKGRLDEAQKKYGEALKADPGYLPALMGLAHLHDHRGQLDAATKQYQAAAAKHPKEAAVYNDMGLCYHRRRMYNEAVAALRKAVELKPDKALYRNNLATVLVETDQVNEALAQLTKAHGAAKAHYNLGYLLQQKGRTDEAIAHFQVAIGLDPALKPAHQWLARLQPPAGGRPATPPAYTAQVSDGAVAPRGRSAAPAARLYVPQAAPEPTPSPEYLRGSSNRTPVAPPTVERGPATGGVRFPARGESGGRGAVPPSPGEAVIDDLEPLPAVLP